ncbi:MAG: preprotein translocase subunit SecG, partial [Planctomycetes bacterium]|nr:preprotein translocase subunit SecG [Planctomycetota bacterium]
MNLLAFELSQWIVGLMVVLFLFISVCMVLIVLIQRPQGGGLSGAFGGGGAEGAGQTAFGAKTGDVLTTVTIGIFDDQSAGAIQGIAESTTLRAARERFPYNLLNGAANR